MTPEKIDTFKRILAKQAQIGDKYVIVDAKWLQSWKRFIGIETSADEQPPHPGEIDFTILTHPESIRSTTNIQLRPDALEGNDFQFIPYELYEELARTYNTKGYPIVRQAVPHGQFDTVIETFLVPLRLRESRSPSATTKRIFRSRRTKVEELKGDICEKFYIRPSSNHRLYSSEDPQSLRWITIDDDPNLTLQDIDLTKDPFIIYESRVSSPLDDIVKTPSPKTYYTRGLCGLSNLGNTCFMNSALQCLSNVPPLTEYFLSKEYKSDINYENPLGTKGDVATAYAELIREIWSGQTNFCAPRSLKQQVARYAPQFSGFAQQDSQEFMSFLLDGLHEDLNKVKKKPYFEKMDDDGKKSDQQLAGEEWEYYRKRNRSRIHDIFHGQIKSNVQCLECGQTARTFDPICFLSLPLPGKGKLRIFKIDYVRLDGMVNSYSIKCDDQLRMRELIVTFCNRFVSKQKENKRAEPMDHDGATSNTHEINEDDEDEAEDEEDFTKLPNYDGHQPKPDFIMAVEIYNHRIQVQYNDMTLLRNILDRDQIVFYETAHSLKEPTGKWILMPCTFRQQNYYHDNFGLPVYLSVPRQGCKGKHIDEALQKVIGRFLPLPSTTSSSNARGYVASLAFMQGYNPRTKPLEELLDESIDFGVRNVSLYVDVDASIVEQYRKEKEKDSIKRISSIGDSGGEVRSQEKRTTTLLDCFKLFTRKETLSDDDLWKCPKCKELKKATKKIDLWLLPEILIIQLKRFNYTRYYRDKIDLLIDFPICELDISPFVVNGDERKKAKYDLIAVSNHMGGLGGGHYTAYAKNSEDKRWHNFDDSYVSDATEKEIVSKSAYVLIYQQRKK